MAPVLVQPPQVIAGRAGLLKWINWSMGFLSTSIFLVGLSKMSGSGALQSIA